MPCTGCIHVSEATYQLLPNHTFNSTGKCQHSVGVIVLRCFPDLCENGVHICRRIIFVEIKLQVKAFGMPQLRTAAKKLQHPGP